MSSSHQIILRLLLAIAGAGIGPVAAIGQALPVRRMGSETGSASAFRVAPGAMAGI